jgi:hypothetical protein
MEIAKGKNKETENETDDDTDRHCNHEEQPPVVASLLWR